MQLSEIKGATFHRRNNNHADEKEGHKEEGEEEISFAKAN